ncbi:MAG: mechanosensitive ion channel family protein [Deltaproteobacteria bacterium]|nr:mechanosensitive ion channel family protein [Deltaproteobacteria bacterium]MCL5792848.1 mechanosensitive ion channel family protein [Deltaproteobacteria bacterium]
MTKREITNTIKLLVFFIIIGIIAGVSLHLIAIHTKMIPMGFSSIIDAAIIFILGMIIIKVIQRFIANTFMYISEDNAGVLKFFINLIVYSALLIIIFSVLGINVTNILLGATFLGIVLGLAAQTILSNLFAGIIILFAKPFKIGDRITVVTWQWGVSPSTYQHEALKPGYTGMVKDVNLLFTTIKEDNGMELKAPNNVLMSALITNYSGVKKRITRVRFELDKKVEPGAFKKALESYLDQDEIILKEPSPAIRTVDLTLNSYFIAVEVYSEEINEDPVRDIILNFCLNYTKGVKQN